MTSSILDTPSPPAAWREQALAMSLLRGGRGTRTARLLKELLDLGQGRIPDADLPDRLAERLGIPPMERALRWSEATALARTHLDDGARAGLTILTCRDESYPSLLGHITDPPVVLWTRGSPSVLAKPAVAIVGSRAATPMAIAVARRLGRDLARQGLVIVSGLARGVDGAAHEGALEAGGETVAVLGSGCDVIYPREHAALATRIAATGALVSEFAPGTQVRPGHFPMRNRIISGVARAVVVVEASERSGSLITARLALDQGREVLAVPGNVLSGRSRGCHLLIRDGAGIVESAGDVLEHLGWARRLDPNEAGSTNSLHLNELEGRMKRGEPYSIEDLAGSTGQPVATLLADPGILELEGRIVRTDGGRYLRLD